MKGLTDIDEGTIRRIDWQELMPGTMLFRAFSMAFRLFPVIMFSLLVSLWISGSGGCPQDTMIPKMFRSETVCSDADCPQGTAPSPSSNSFSFSKKNIFSLKIDLNQKTSNNSGSDNFSERRVTSKMLTPMDSDFWKISLNPFCPFYDQLPRGEQAEFSCQKHIALVLALLALSIFWAMNARSSAVRLASSERSGFFDSLKYTLDNYKTIVCLCLVYLFFTFLPALIAWGLHWGASLCGQEIGAVILPAKLFFVFCFGISFVFFTVAFPLMMSAIAVEKCDAFEAFSRGLSYVLARPLHYFFYLLIAGIFALIGFFLLQLAVQCSLTFLKNFVPLLSENARSGWSLFWIRSLLLIPFGFLLTFFITAETTIYLILRRSVDGTPVATWHSNSSHKPSRKLSPLMDETPLEEVSDDSKNNDSDASSGDSHDSQTRGSARINSSESSESENFQSSDNQHC